MACVPAHEPPMTVEHAKPLRHVAQGCVKLHVDACEFGRLLKSVLLLARPFGNVFMGGDPPAVGQRPVRDLKRTSVGGLQGNRLPACNMFENSGAEFVDIDLNESEFVS